MNLISLTFNFPLAFKVWKRNTCVCMCVYVHACVYISVCVYIYIHTHVSNIYISYICTPRLDSGILSSIQHNYFEYTPSDIDPVPFLTEKEPVNNYQSEE